MEQPLMKTQQETNQTPSFDRIMMWVTTVSFILVLLTIGLGTLVREDRVRSQLENRTLAQSVEPTVEGIATGKDMLKMETYFTDQLLLRGTFVEIQALLSKDVFRQPFRNGIYTAKNDYMIEPSASGNVKIPQAFKQFVGEVDRPVYMALAPSKTVIAERDKLIPSYVASNANERYEKMVRDFQAAGMTNLSLQGLKLSDYFKTDHHWNIDGATEAYQVITKRMGLSTTLPETKWRKEDQHAYYGSLARKTTLSYAASGDRLDYYAPAFFNGIDVCYEGKCGRPVIDESFVKQEGDYVDRYEVFLRGNHDIMSMKSAANRNRPTILVLKDSFANPVLPLLAKSANLEIVDIRYVPKSFDVSRFAKQKQIDSVLFLHNSNIAGLMKTYEDKL
ncbi:DHHW family protein [Exiguobacterium acetylicum]|uniref:DHHW family protein n=1 Tax=Exiguobacterium acetylicum TaxID=41170 RepID=UPI0027E06445|nr:DHHW family protein [Exiguobacterium acetylicum]MDQ6465998.1 DHHW family protein [Exiguobacterium acetylicum]